MNKIVRMLKKVLGGLWDLLAWCVSIIFIISGITMIGQSIPGTMISLLAAIFLCPLRRKLLRKIGVRPKKRITILIAALLCSGSLYFMGSIAGSEVTPVETKTEEERKLLADKEKTAETVKNSKDILENTGGGEQKDLPNSNPVKEEKENEKEGGKTEGDSRHPEKEESAISEKKEENPEDTLDTKLEIHFIDVGQADATLFLCDGEAMLLDAGTSENGTLVQLYLKKRGVSDLKYLILTHPDEDHIGGADVIITKYPVGQVFMPSYEKDTKAYRELVDALEYQQHSWGTPKVGSTYSLGGATITVIAPNKNYDDANESSVGILVTHEENTFLFTGDAEYEAEKDIVKNGINIDCDVLKAGHHGSKTANSSVFLQAATPEYVVVSCGEDNSYGHPHAGPMNEFRSMGVKLFRTDEQGSIVVESDGKNLTWNTPPTDSWKAGEPKKTDDSEEVRQSSSYRDTQSTAGENTQKNISTTEPAEQTSGNHFAVNDRNGKIHITGACSATGTGKQAMKEPVYFATYEEAESYSVLRYPAEDNRRCGKCYK